MNTKRYLERGVLLCFFQNELVRVFIVILKSFKNGDEFCVLRRVHHMGIEVND